MSWLRNCLDGRYKLKLLLSIFLLSLLIISVQFGTVFYKYQHAFLINQTETNQKMLDQVNYNIDFTNKLLEALISSAFYDPGTIELMNSMRMKEYELYKNIMSFEKIINASPLLQEVVVYNASNNCYYSYSDNRVQNCKNEGAAGMIERYMKAADSIPKLKLLPVFSDKPDGSGNAAEFFIYTLYAKNEKSSDRGGMLIFVVKPEWVFANILRINALTGYGDSSVIILDHTGRQINERKETPSAVQAVKSMKDEEGRTAASFIDKSGKEAKLVSYAASETNDWTIINIQSYDAVFNAMKQMKAFVILDIAIIAICVLLGSVLLVSRLYHPIAGVLHLIRKNEYSAAIADKNAVSKPLGEFRFISAVLEGTMNEVERLKKSEAAQSAIVRSYYLRKVMEGQDSAAMEMLGSYIGLELAESMPLRLCMFMLDSNTKDAYAAVRIEQENVKTLVSDMIREQWSDYCRFDLADMGEDRIIAVIYGPEDPKRQIGEMARKLQLQLASKRQVSITAVIGAEFYDLSNIAEEYNKILVCAKYRLYFGRQSFITPDMTDRPRAKENVLPADLLKKWTDSVKMQNVKLHQSFLTQLFEDMGRLHYDDTMHVLLQLSATFNQVVQEINENRRSQRHFDMGTFLQKMMVQETLDDIRMLFQDAFHETIADRSQEDKPVAESRNQVSEMIKDIVRREYTDPNLCQKSLAEKMNLSSAYIGKLFRKSESMSISDYIIRIRLDTAAQLIKENNMGFSAVMEQVGFTNISYFFRLFKRAFGATPNEYRIKHGRTITP